MIDEQIEGLDDARAVRTLSLVAEAHQVVVPAPSEASGLVPALSDAVDTGDEPTPTDGEAARQALKLLARDPTFAAPIEAVLSGPRPEGLGLGVVEGALLIGGLMLVLQSHIEFERDKDGKWSVTIKKEPTSDPMLKPLIKKLISLLPFA